jgi:hypothetical protein
MKSICVAITVLSTFLLAAGPPAPNPYVGTWTGTSTCVGNRPACKNETVVYRFVPVGDQPAKLRLYGDKIIEGKRVPMDALDFDYDQKAGSVRCEFRIGNSHGVWSFMAEGDSLAGELIILPDSTKGRDVKAHRVKDEKEVPPAPALKEYEE